MKQKRSQYFEEIGGRPESSRCYYGMTAAEWNALSTEEREIHYNRNRPNGCDHPYTYPGIEGNIDDDRLRDQYSHDPYFHTAHMLPHSVEAFFSGTCECQTCAGKFGIPRENEERRMSKKKVCEKLTQKLCEHPDHQC